MWQTYKPRDKAPVRGSGTTGGSGGLGGGGLVTSSISVLAGGISTGTEFLLATTIAPAGSMRIGTMLRFTAGFTYQTDVAGQGFQIKIRRNWGGSNDQLFNWGLFQLLDLGGAGGAGYGSVRATMMSVAPDVGVGTIRCLEGVCIISPSSISGGFNNGVTGTNNTVSADLTQQQTICLTGTFSGSDASNLITCYGAFLEIYDPQQIT